MYEHLLTKALASGLAEAEARTESVKAEQLASLVSRHVAGEVRRLFALAPGSSHMDLALDLAERLFGAVAEVAARHNVEGVDFAQEAFEPPARRLLAVGVAAKQRPRPQSPLASSTLFTRSALEPRLSAELAHEIECADRVDAIVAFITVGGVRSLGEALERLCLQGGAGAAAAAPDDDVHGDHGGGGARSRWRALPGARGEGLATTCGARACTRRRGCSIASTG